MWALARTSVDENSPYAYLMMGEFFSDTCAVAALDEPDRKATIEASARQRISGASTSPCASSKGSASRRNTR